MSTTPLNATTDESRGAAEQPWQFRVRTTLIVLAAASVLFTILRMVGILWSVIVVWMLLLVAAHVIANAWGTRQRGRRASHRAVIDIAASQRSIDAEIKQQLAPATRLRNNTNSGWLTLACTIVGIVVGGSSGTLALVSLYYHKIDSPAVALGGMSAAVIGGFAGFLLATFTQIAAHAWHEADQHSRR
jgi:ABC-type xylose transport system permease subunit